MKIRVHQYLFILGLVTVVTNAKGEYQNPKCWKHYGECLDRNEPPLDIENRVKPRENQNVIKTIQNIYTVEQCLKECEKESECNYYTLYRPDVLKDCHLVGFNLGTTCQRLANACVLYKSCTQFDQRCDKGCPAGRRLVQDLSADYYTIIVGGTRKDRSQYADKWEIFDNTGKSCNMYEYGFPTKKTEGAAGVFLTMQNRQQDNILMCGGFREEDGYIKTCEEMVRGSEWSDSSKVLQKERAFHSMASIRDKAFAFGGYNNDVGMLDSIEIYSGSTGEWTTSAISLPSARSHTCAVHVNMEGKDSIYVLGGWDHELAYIGDIIKYDLNEADLEEDTDFSHELPADREGVSNGRSDMACMYYRWEGWRDGILMVGGYRASGAWLNSAWFLDLTLALNSSDTTNPWIRMEDLSKNFDGGRHYHGLSFSGNLPMVLGGWNNLNLQGIQIFDECLGQDPARVGKWTFDRKKYLSMGREKFVTLSVPKYMIPVNRRCL
eukprot:TRINITY_DN12084_c0_g1_i1.p1 TRINITY_DN12084_c0_g1~~TRINITY_DN12084_c0_g1_i1.p1  ORF type:complete len:493 (-),score=78.87 TRINITY_DN12084_c0_g1_i1:149-1627(-)